ncbi:MAG: nucleotide exchange factor GrpE [Candidatus Acidiferrales bacterium]
MTDLTEKKNPRAPEAEETPALSLEDRVGKLEEEKKRLEEENRSLFDQLLRRQADFDNFRKRLERERTEFRQAAQAQIVEGLLPVLDAFERALAAPTSGVDEDYRKGVELIYKQFADTLAAQGLEPIEATGQPFDPNLHHAVERVETTQHPDEEVLATLQKGYRLRQRLLRPAMVRVAVHPPAGSGADK